MCKIVIVIEMLSLSINVTPDKRKGKYKIAAFSIEMLFILCFLWFRCVLNVSNVGPWPVRGQNPIPNPSYLQVSALKRWRQMCKCDILNEGQLRGPTNSFV